MELIRFLEPYKNGRESEALKVLKNEYLVGATELNGKVLLKYDRFANKNIPIVRECRGIILSAKGFEVISLPLDKFGNYGEPYAHNDIDIAKCRVYEKCDGSCFCLYWDQLCGLWCVQTLGQVEAEKTIVGFGKMGRVSKPWAELFWSVFEQYAGRDVLEKLDKDFTYVFELCTPWNRIVVSHDKPKLYFLALRNKKTFAEEWTDKCVLHDVFDRPKIYNYSDINQILKVAREQLTKEDEGFVLVDKDFRRVKIKSVQYVAEHYQSTTITLRNIARILFLNEQDEWLLAFPEYKSVIDIMTKELERLGKEVDDYFQLCLSKMNDKVDRKELASIVKSTPGTKIARNYVFQVWSGQYKNGMEGIMDVRANGALIKKVNDFLEKSNVHAMVEHNPNTKSLRSNFPTQHHHIRGA